MDASIIVHSIIRMYFGNLCSWLFGIIQVQIIRFSLILILFSCRKLSIFNSCKELYYVTFLLLTIFIYILIIYKQIINVHLLLLRLLSTNGFLRSHFRSLLFPLQYELGSLCHPLLSIILFSATMKISSFLFLTAFYLIVYQQL